MVLAWTIGAPTAIVDAHDRRHLFSGVRANRGSAALVMLDGLAPAAQHSSR